MTLELLFVILATPLAGITELTTEGLPQSSRYDYIRNDPKLRAANDAFNRSHKVLAEAKRLYLAGSFNAALATCAKAIDSLPDSLRDHNDPHYRLIGRIRMAQGRFEDALLAFSKAVPKQEDFELAMAHFYVGNVEESKKACTPDFMKRMSEYSPPDCVPNVEDPVQLEAALLYGRGGAYYMEHEKKDAMRDLRASLQLYPRFVMPAYLIAETTWSNKDRKGSWPYYYIVAKFGVGHLVGRAVGRIPYEMFEKIGKADVRKRMGLPPEDE